MKYCPKCQTLADTSESPACVICGTVLLSTGELSPEDADRAVVLTYCATEEEATVLKTALAGMDIEAIVEDEGLMGLGIFYSDPSGPLGPRVMVHLKDAEAALEFLRRKQAGELAITDSDVEAAEAEEPPADEAPGEPEDK